MPPSGNPDIRTLGGLVKYSKVICSTLALGPELGDKYPPDNLAQAILRSFAQPIAQHNGKATFCNNRLGDRSLIFIPFVPIAEKYTNSIPLYVCQEQDYDKYFEGNIKDAWAQYMHKSKVTSMPNGRVLITNTANHYYLNRVLQITRESNYPILQIA